MLMYCGDSGCIVMVVHIPFILVVKLTGMKNCIHPCIKVYALCMCECMFIGFCVHVFCVSMFVGLYLCMYQMYVIYNFLSSTITH